MNYVYRVITVRDGDPVPEGAWFFRHAEFIDSVTARVLLEMATDDEVDVHGTPV